MDFPPASPEDFMIIPAESTFRVTGLSPEEKVVILEKKWEGTPYSMVAEACKRMLSWDPDRGGKNRETLLAWMGWWRRQGT